MWYTSLNKPPYFGSPEDILSYLYVYIYTVYTVHAVVLNISSNIHTYLLTYIHSLSIIGVPKHDGNYRRKLHIHSYNSALQNTGGGRIHLVE